MAAESTTLIQPSAETIRDKDEETTSTNSSLMDSPYARNMKASSESRNITEQDWSNQGMERLNTTRLYGFKKLQTLNLSCNLLKVCNLYYFFLKLNLRRSVFFE